ncbi:hypothetical protein H6B10_17735, partial [Gemmiger formicilis]|uniref:hypothetical protein n=1 Tax=Gemmiger formicilis TaxID=745368 RepID=UPI00195DE344
AQTQIPQRDAEVLEPEQIHHRHNKGSHLPHNGGNGGAAYLSLKLGEKDVENARRGVGNAIAMVVLVSVVLTA